MQFDAFLVQKMGERERERESGKKINTLRWFRQAIALRKKAGFQSLL